VVKFDDLELAFQFASSGAPMENRAYLCRDTGAIYWHSEFGDNEEELPEDIESDKYIALPHKNDLNLGKRLVLDFVAEVLPERTAEVQEIFSRRGAYRRFKGLLDDCEKMQQWHEYEDKAQVQALRQWCEHHGIEIDD